LKEHAARASKHRILHIRAAGGDPMKLLG